MHVKYSNLSDTLSLDERVSVADLQGCTLDVVSNGDIREYRAKGVPFANFVQAKETLTDRHNFSLRHILPEMTSIHQKLKGN